MSRSLNRVTLLGHLGKDAVTNFTQSRIPCTKFSIATERSWMDPKTKEWKKESAWHNVVLWRMEKLGQYLTKGTQVYVEGRINYRKYEDNGRQMTAVEIIAEQVILLGNRSGTGGARPAAGASAEPTAQYQEPAYEESFGGVNGEEVPF